MKMLFSNLGSNSFPHENYLGIFRHGTKQKNISEFSIVSRICCSHFWNTKVCFHPPSGFFHYISRKFRYPFWLHYSVNITQLFFSCSNVQFQYHLFILLTVCDLFFNKITNTKFSLVSIQLLGTLYKNVKLVMQRFKYLLFFNSKFSLNLTGWILFFSYIWCNSWPNWLFLVIF